MSIDTQNRDVDPALNALSALSQVATASANELNALDADLDSMRQKRTLGWSWRRIVADRETANPISIVTNIASGLGRANAALRRALARELRTEGMQVNEIATLFEVSRQRIGALIRSRRDRADETN